MQLYYPKSTQVTIKFLTYLQLVIDTIYCGNFLYWFLFVTTLRSCNLNFYWDVASFTVSRDSTFLTSTHAVGLITSNIKIRNRKDNSMEPHANRSGISFLVYSRLVSCSIRWTMRTNNLYFDY